MFYCLLGLPVLTIIKSVFSSFARIVIDSLKFNIILGFCCHFCCKNFYEHSTLYFSYWKALTKCGMALLNVGILVFCQVPCKVTDKKP